MFRPSAAGGDRVISIYARYLKQHGHSVEIVGLATPRPSFKQSIKNLYRGKRREPSPTLHFENAGINVRLVKNSDSVTDDNIPDADVVIGTYWLTAEWVAQLNPSKGVKAYFVQANESKFPGVDIDRVKDTYRKPLKKITISKEIDDLMRNEFDDAPVALIHNSVDHQQFYAQPRAKNAIPTVGFIYHNSSLKGVDTTLKAIEAIRDKIPNLKIVSFGACVPDKTLPLPAGCDFQFHPQQNDIRKFYARCDVWLSASRYEGFGLPLLESMACRCPVVTTNVGAAQDLVTDGVQGYIVPIDDSEALAEKALKVLTVSDDDWQKMSDNAHETATRYNWDDAGALFEAALFKIVEENRNTEQ